MNGFSTMPDERLGDFPPRRGELINTLFGEKSQLVEETLLKAVKKGFPEEEVCQLMESKRERFSSS